MTLKPDSSPEHHSTSYSSFAAVDLDSSIPPPPGSLCSSSESSAQQRVRRGNEERERLVHSGFKAPSPRPLPSSVLTASPEHMTRLSP
ncbi:hypothetical protein NQZ68_011956 [Dissostichus eleginoides]|nr:hypothetical protein NQZ68_011956 [Dissostichus eleginoides]